MASESILNKVNVFPSLSSFNNNSAAVDSNSLNLIKTGAILIETWVSGTSWYRKYSDGWIEQGGRGGGTKTLPVEMRDTNYNISIAQNGAPDTWSTNITAPNSTTTITINTAYNTPHWRVCGYAK